MNAIGAINSVNFRGANLRTTENAEVVNAKVDAVLQKMPGLLTAVTYAGYLSDAELKEQSPDRMEARVTLPNGVEIQEAHQKNGDDTYIVIGNQTCDMFFKEPKEGEKTKFLNIRPDKNVNNSDVNVNLENGCMTIHHGELGATVINKKGERTDYDKDGNKVKFEKLVDYIA